MSTVNELRLKIQTLKGEIASLKLSKLDLIKKYKQQVNEVRRLTNLKLHYNSYIIMRLIPITNKLIIFKICTTLPEAVNQLNILIGFDKSKEMGCIVDGASLYNKKLTVYWKNFEKLTDHTASKLDQGKFYIDNPLYK